MPGQGMARMIQMITALAEMQDRRRKIALEEDQFDESKKQFASQMGFNEKGQRQTAAMNLLSQISAGGVDAHVAAPKLAQLLGFTPEESQVFTSAAPNAQAAAQMFSTARQQAGLNSMTPEQRTNAEQATYLAQQANTSPGGLATSNLQARMANTPISPDLAQRAGEGFVMRQATGQDPFSFGVGQAGLDQNLAPPAARIGAGLDPSWMNKAQDQYWRGSLMNDQNAQAMRGQGAGQPDLGSFAALMNTATGISRALAEGKYADENMRDVLVDQYNRMAPMLGLQPLKVKGKKSGTDIPESTGAIMQGINKLGGIKVPPVEQNPQSWNPAYRPPVF